MLLQSGACWAASHLLLAFCPSLSQRHILLLSACGYGTVKMLCDLNNQPKASSAMVIEQGLLEQGNADAINVHCISPLQLIAIFQYRKYVRVPQR